MNAGTDRVRAARRGHVDAVIGRGALEEPLVQRLLTSQATVELRERRDHPQQRTPVGRRVQPLGERLHAHITPFEQLEQSEDTGPGRPEIACDTNFSSEPRPDYRIGLPSVGVWKEILNTDASGYDGTGQLGNLGQMVVVDVLSHGYDAWPPGV